MPSARRPDRRHRLVAWNCCGKFANNYGHLLDLDYDVAVVAECSPIAFESMGGRAVTHSFVSPIPGSMKHLGVLARAPWRIEPHQALEPRPWLLPMQVTGPASYTLLGFWAAEPRLHGSYTSQLRTIALEVLPKVDGPVVLAGDFNAPIATSTRAHEDNVRFLQAAGLVSAFTATRRPGAEATEPTYFQWLREDRPFHIDHIFVPKEWTAGLALTVGSFAPWVSERRSDHVPLVADVVARPGRVTG